MPHELAVTRFVDLLARIHGGIGQVLFHHCVIILVVARSENHGFVGVDADDLSL